MRFKQLQVVVPIALFAAAGEAKADLVEVTATGVVDSVFGLDVAPDILRGAQVGDTFSITAVYDSDSIGQPIADANFAGFVFSLESFEFRLNGNLLFPLAPFQRPNMSQGSAPSLGRDFVTLGGFGTSESPTPGVAFFGQLEGDPGSLFGDGSILPSPLNIDDFTRGSSISFRSIGGDPLGVVFEAVATNATWSSRVIPTPGVPAGVSMAIVFFSIRRRG